MSDTLLARDVMVKQLITARPETDVFDAIHVLLKKRVTGAPVVEGQHSYLGVFSEKSSLAVVQSFLSRSAERVLSLPTVTQFMSQRILMLPPDEDAIHAIGHLLKHRVSGVPIVDSDRRFIGVFSEKTSMEVLVQSAFDQVPTARVSGFANEDRGRIVAKGDSLLDVVETFLETPYRRLVVIDQGRVIGQVSRRDALNAAVRWLDQSGSPLPTAGVVSDSMDVDAKTILPELDLLGVAQIFLNTNYRRLPVVQSGELIGQLSRRDVLAAFHRALEPRREETQKFLYLSSVRKPDEVSIQ